MAQDREEIIQKLRALMNGQGYHDIQFGIDRTGSPFADYSYQSGGSKLGREDIIFAINFLQEYLAICPSDVEVAHSSNRWCGNFSCEQCYEFEHQGAQKGLGFWPVGQLRQGFVVLYEVNGKHNLFSSSKPEERLRAIEREFGESIRYIHRIETNDQLLLKNLWLQNFADFRIYESDWYNLSDKAITAFKLRDTMDVDRKESWSENMGELDLADVANFQQLRSNHPVQRRFNNLAP